MLLCECVRVYCFFTVLPVYVLSCAAYGVIKNDDDDDDCVYPQRYSQTEWT